MAPTYNYLWVTIIVNGHDEDVFKTLDVFHTVVSVENPYCIVIFIWPQVEDHEGGRRFGFVSNIFLLKIAYTWPIFIFAFSEGPIKEPAIFGLPSQSSDNSLVSRLRFVTSQAING